MGPLNAKLGNREWENLVTHDFFQNISLCSTSIIISTWFLPNVSSFHLTGYIKVISKAYPDMPSLQARNARTCARARNHMATGLLDLANDDEESVLKFRDLFQSNFCANLHRVRVSSRVFDDFQYFCWIRRFMHKPKQILCEI